jgi:hypothetical protein
MVEKQLRNAAYTPRTNMKLDLSNYKESKHISRINISDNYKFVINSPEVHFGTKRQHQKLVTKI